jgi:hypothetical protein
MINRLTIRARLILLSGALLVVLVGTNLYLTRILANNSQAAARATELVDLITVANEARIAFGEVRYWTADLAVSLLTASERNAAVENSRSQSLPLELSLPARSDAAVEGSGQRGAGRRISAASGDERQGLR